jgi:hypothetical protein
MKQKIYSLVILFIWLQFLNACSITEQLKDVKKESIDFSSLFTKNIANGKTELQLTIEIDKENGWLVFKDTTDFNLAMKLMTQK